MSSRNEAIVTPSLMKWAREKAGFDIPIAAGKFKRPESDIIGWENGTKYPSLAQAREACRIYRRSLAVFFLPEPPEDFDTLRDFRLLPSDEERNYSPALALLLRQVFARQEWAREFLIDEGEEKVAFVGSATSQDNPLNLARTIRNTLGVTLENQARCRGHREALNLWINHIEGKGIYVCRQGKVEPKEARGFALADPYAPFVFVNSSDALSAQIFTLLHEVVHLWINQPGISNLVGLDENINTQDLEIERFCNKAASEILVERNSFNVFWNSSTGNLAERIEKTSRRFWVSEEVIARRLADQQVISLEQYLTLRKGYAERWQAYRKKSKGGGSYYLNMVARNGRFFTRLVIGAYNSARLTGRDASFLLGAKLGHFTKLYAEAGGAFYQSGRISQ